jgi:hypothetical protein
MSLKYFFLFLAFCLTCENFAQKKKFPKIVYATEAELDKKMEDLAEKSHAINYNSSGIDSIFRVVNYYFIKKQYDSLINILPHINEFYKEKYPEFHEYMGKSRLVYVKSKIREKNKAISFEESYYEELSKYIDNIKDEKPLYVEAFFKNQIIDASDYLKKSLENQKDSITLQDAHNFIITYNNAKLYEETHEIVSKVLRDREKENYAIKDSIIIKNGNAEISLRAIRSKKSNEKLPTILQFSIYPNKYDRDLAKYYAKKGYNAVIAYTRGKWLSNDKLRSFEHDGDDVNTVIDWIVKQPWSDGQVGMLGGSYLGFTQWAAVKKVHPALKTIVPQVAVGVGVDYPMQNNVFMSYMLRWIHYVENNKFTDRGDFSDVKKWQKVYADWFESGLSYRKLDSIDGRPSETFQRWLNHPSRDEFWQNMVADKEDFFKIDIPVLTTTGYFDDDQTGAMYYLREHYKYYKNPEHYLVIGPYDHGGGQGSPSEVLKGYKLDSVAKISINDLAFEWFDYVLKGKEKPKLLQDKINYQVMDSNTWKHVPSLSELYKNQQVFYLSNEKIGDYFKLKTTKGNSNTYVSQEIDFSDRKKIHEHIDFEKLKIVDSTFNSNNGLVFVSEPFEKDTEISGSFSGELSVMINKKDIDYTLQLFEQKLDGTYFYLSNHIQRASYSESREKRKLLKPNKKTKLTFKDTYFTSKKLAKGSKLILIVNINKNPEWQVNHGTGKDVSLETIKDAGEPLRVKWFTDSFIKIPIN